MTAPEIIKLASEKGWGFTGVYLTKNGMSILPEDWWAEGAPENPPEE